MNSSTNTDKPRFRFIGYLIKETNMNLSTNVYGKGLTLDISPFGALDKEGGSMNVDLRVSVRDDENKLSLTFLISGHFEFECKTFEELKPYICMNAPAILFPYIRAYATSITSLAGCNPVIMPTLNLEGVGKQLLSLIEDKQLDTK
ncbi:protein-export chaperone SecB [uncultured Porphyromonas sp.]|uniref:protein-export chaperone SecB n=1 Tax=uncultured Porphyromonas sp. TaxID=159274 RepID=UPI00259BEB83|nr:protein-export chaperone SecB [uncultured Porphyromonas sp.]